ncbi:MAG: glycosyltransferase [Roseobacter sp.]|jgi:hypothetical protein|nr:glycosyltransferase [Roseobacter sp.]
MILLCSGEISQKYFDALLVLALQLEKRGHHVAIDDRFICEDLSQQQKYEMTPFLASFSDISPECAVVVTAGQISDEVQIILGSMRLDITVAIWAIGSFDDLQSEIGVRNRIAYSTGIEPQVLNLAAPNKPIFLEEPIGPLLTEIRSEPDQNDGATSRVLAYVPVENLEADDTILSQFAVLKHGRNLNLNLLTSAKGKSLIRGSRYLDLSVFSYSELPPSHLLNYLDVLVFFGRNIPGERMATLALNAMGAGKVVIDCTETSALMTSGAPVLKGPPDPAALFAYLQDTVSQNRIEIGRRIQQADWLRHFDITALERDLELDRKPALESDDTPKTVFFPTNGNGMGHAQRCALIAEEMDPKSERLFTAFPSCVDMLQNRGFSCVPLVPRSPDHSEDYAADLLNYLRLRSIVKAGDRIVFDGGYVFDSVYRLISSLQTSAIWIRRGLWRAGQINPVALERERAFSKVIVPTEAFAELNTDYSFGDHIAKVGPVVRQHRLDGREIKTLRNRLADQFDRRVDTLVVTMLGGGVASERTAQTQLLCSILEQRENCVHLVVAWPNAVVSNGLYGWKNSYVVQTHHALDLCQAADLTISAAGYNSFHEILYAHVPAILIPQSAPYMDDQERRARAAVERGVSGFVQESELLNLEREVSAFLDDGKADEVRSALRDTNLPEPGNSAAAELITEARNT